MEENINIFALVLDELNKNDMWFTTKADPTVEEASSYYKLDEYGEPTEATVKKIEKEVSSLIGDGAVYIEDAVELWINDALVDFKIDYKDNLVTQFEDKPVVDNIEAYENPVQFPQSKKIEVKTKKTEYYKMPDDEHIIWDSEVDYYDDDYMEDVKENQYQDYLDDFEPSEPLSYEEWLDSEECYDNHYHWFEDSGIADGDWDGLVDLYEVEFKEDYDDYVANYKDEPLPFDKWYDNYIQQVSYDDWEYLEDDLKSNIFPEIDKQVNDDVLILSGYYGSNYQDFKSSGAGGKLFEKGTKDFRDYMSNFDRVCITTQNGILGAVLGDHDGTVSGQFFTLPDDKSELFKALDLENKVKEDYTDQEIDWENETVGEYDSMGNYRNYDLEDLVEKEFYELLEYGGLDARDFTTHLELLKPIKDTISGYAPQGPEGTKTESKSESNESSYKDEFIKYCDGKVQKLSKKVKYPVYNDDEDSKETFEVVMIGNDGNEWLINTSDDDSIVHYWDGTELKLVLPPYGSVSEVLAELNFSAIDKKLYKNTLEYWDELDMDYIFDESKTESKEVKTEAKELKFKVNDIVEDKTGVGKIMEIDPEHPEGLIYGVQFSNVDLPNDKDDIGLWWCKEGDIALVTDKNKIDKYNKWFNTEYNKLESKKAERKKKQIEAFKNRKVNFNKRTKEENYQRRLDEVNNKSKNLISDMFSSNNFDSDSPAGQIVMRTSEMFNALSDKGYDVEVTFDNGESTSAIQLGQQGGKVMITITNSNQPLRAFTSGNFEINDQNIKMLQDIQSQIKVL